MRRSYEIRRIDQLCEVAKNLSYQLELLFFNKVIIKRGTFNGNRVLSMMVELDVQFHICTKATLKIQIFVFSYKVTSLHLLFNIATVFLCTFVMNCKSVISLEKLYLFWKTFFYLNRFFSLSTADFSFI